MKYAEINIKQDMPTVSEAMRYLQDSIERKKREKVDVLLIVHGYGSSGKGGSICTKSRQWLKAQERAKAVKQVIFGEDFTIFNSSLVSNSSILSSIKYLKFSISSQGGKIK